jgi:hypothetical protein
MNKILYDHKMLLLGKFSTEYILKISKTDGMLLNRCLDVEVVFVENLFSGNSFFNF